MFDRSLERGGKGRRRKRKKKKKQKKKKKREEERRKKEKGRKKEEGGRKKEKERRRKREKGRRKKKEGGKEKDEGKKRKQEDGIWSGRSKIWGEANIKTLRGAKFGEGPNLKTNLQKRVSSGGGREGSLSGCIWRLPAGSLIGTAGTEATGTGYLRGFLMGALVGDLSADVAQCGYFGTKNGHVLWGPMPGRRRS